MPDFADVPEFLRFLMTLPEAVRIATEAGLARAGKLVADEARSEIAQYQSAAGPFKEWAPLADSTMEEKTRLGYAPPDNPLLRMGDLRDSIGHQVTEHAGSPAVVVGSTSPIAVYQELGSRRMPARSFLAGALFRKRDEAINEAAGAIVGAMAGRKK